MKAIYFDCFSGISGDMALGALLDLGIDKELFMGELDRLNLAGYDILISKVCKYGITGTDVQIVVNEEYGDFQEKVKKHENRAHEHAHNHSGAGGGHVRRHAASSLKSIETLIYAGDLKQSVKDLSKKIFREIARAEAKVHGMDINEIHFHEVGAIDSIVDIVGTAICLDLLGVKKVFSSPLHDGRGFIECRHGILPVPVPAVMEMLSDSKIPLISEDINTELITPTGIGIIKCLTKDFGNMPAMMVDRIGYGFGKRETGRLNALRVVMGNTFEEDACEDAFMEEISVLETNIDDLSPEILGFTSEKLMQSGALDVFFTPVYMKKNRPAYMLSVLANKEREQELADIILRETTTLGIRKISARRYCMDRELVNVKTQYGEARVKVASKGDFKKFSPEYEDCRDIAIKAGIPLKEVYEYVAGQYKEQSNQPGMI